MIYVGEWVREQLVAVGTFLLPYGTWRIRLSFQTLWQVPLPIESSCCHPKLVSRDRVSQWPSRPHPNLDWLSSESQGSS